MDFEENYSYLKKPKELYLGIILIRFYDHFQMYECKWVSTFRRLFVDYTSNKYML